MTRTRGTADSLARAAFRIDQRTQIIETVRGEQAGGYEFPECRFHFGFQFSGAAHDIRKERCATLAQKLKNRSGIGAEAGDFGLARFAAGDHPFRIFADEESDGSNACGNDTAFRVGDGFQRGRMRREASPAYCARQAKLIQCRGIVIRHCGV